MGPLAAAAASEPFTPESPEPVAAIRGVGRPHKQHDATRLLDGCWIIINTDSVFLFVLISCEAVSSH